MKKLLIWGTGDFAKKFIDNQYNGEIIGFIETKKTKNTYMSKPVYNYDEIPKIFDYIIVANIYTMEIYELCKTISLDISKVIFLYGIKQRMGCKEISVIKEILLERNYTLYCEEYGLTEGTFAEEDANLYSKLNQRPQFAIQKKHNWLIIRDKYAFAGTANNYFFQDLWAARLILRSKVKKHFDIGSRLDGFIAHLLAADIDVTMIDVREFPEKIEHLNTIVDDATNLNGIPDESIESMSALCSLEHFGLGRYGDPIDPEACFKCFKQIQKKLKKGGRLYISVPVGMERVEFNAHRIFYADTIVKCFNLLNLKEYSCVAENGKREIEYNVDIHKYDDDPYSGRCGLFYFAK